MVTNDATSNRSTLISIERSHRRRLSMSTRLKQALSRLLAFWILAILFVLLLSPLYPYWIGAGVAAVAVLLILMILNLSICYGLSFLKPTFFLLMGNALAILGLLMAVVLGSLCLNSKVNYLGINYHTEYGVVGVPYFPSFHWNLPDFQARYTFNRFGWRSTPVAAHSKGDILFLGCSFTFGIGVNDNETYPAVIASRYWEYHQIYNCGMSGRGVGDGLLALEEWLKSHPNPSAVFYGWISDQAPRNYRRHSWRARSNDFRFRLFDFKDGALSFMGTVGAEEASLPDSPETDVKEAEVCVAIFEKMRSICQSRGIPFFVVSLSSKYPLERPDRVLPRLAANGFKLIDATAAIGFFTNDSHPTPAWHVQVAKIINAAVKPSNGTLSH